MGLLDVMDDPQFRLGMGLLGAGAARPDNAGLGVRLNEVLGGMDQWKKQKGEEKKAALQEKIYNAQLMELQQKAAAEQAAVEAEKRRREAFPTLFKSGNSEGAVSFNQPYGFDMISQGVNVDKASIAGPRTLDVDAAIKAGYKLEDIPKLDALRNVGLNEVAGTYKGMVDGKEVEQMRDKFGRPVGQGIVQWKAPILNDGGGQTNVLDPYNPLKPLGSIPKTMTFGDKTAAANLALSRERLAFDKAGGVDAFKPQFNQELGGFVFRPDASNPQGKFVPLSGAPVGGKLTEDQAKASGWLVQAENAFGNMTGAMKREKGVESVGAADLIANVPMLGGVGNWLRSPDRQRFVQGASSLSESLLRAATGAGVNRDEAKQKIEELTPVFGEDAATTKQKMDAIPLYIEALKVRAGAGAKRVEGITGKQNNAPMLGQVVDGYKFKGGDPSNPSSWEKQ